LLAKLSVVCTHSSCRGIYVTDSDADERARVMNVIRMLMYLSVCLLA